jgi:hypothetical protein
LSYVLAQLNAGVSHAALTRYFMNAASKSTRTISAQAFVNALYMTAASRPPSAVGMAYWLGQLNSGRSREQVAQMFQATNGMLPPPTITWANPADIVYGTALSGAQLNAAASIPCPCGKAA